MASTTTSPQIDWRQEWFEFEDATYLNLAGQSPMPRVSIRAVQAALEAKKFPHHQTDATYFEVPKRIRECIAKVIGAKPELSRSYVSYARVLQAQGEGEKART